jgi:4a-hydroxytetrahydrobiopterin dehydratase
MQRLSNTEIQEKLETLPEWEVIEGALQRTFTLSSFAHAVIFIGAVAQLAEAADHHPDMRLFDYKKVTIELSTHFVKGLTQKDFAMAKQINQIPQKRK